MLPDRRSTELRSRPVETPLTRSEDWANQYRARPYLRSLEEDALLMCGAKLGAESGNMFRKGSRSTQRFGDFMEEFNFRKKDMRSLAPYNEAARIFDPARFDGAEERAASLPHAPGDARNDGD